MDKTAKNNVVDIFHPTDYIEKNFKNILYVESDSSSKKSYIHVKRKRKAILNNNSVARIKEELEKIGKPLFEVHKSYLVNISHITINSLKPSGQDFKLYFENGDFIPVARPKAEKLIYKITKRINLELHEDISNFHDGVARVFYKGKYGFISETEMLIEPKYDDAVNLGFGLIRIKEGKRFGIIDKGEKKLSSFDYDDMRSLHDKRIAVKKNSKWGFLGKDEKDGEMKILIPCIYDEVRDFEHGLSLVTYGNLHMLVDREGRFVLALNSELISECDDNPQYTRLSEILAHYYYWDKKRTLKKIIGEDQLRISELEDFNLDYSNEIFHYTDTDLFYYIGKDPYEARDNLRLTVRINKDNNEEKVECWGFMDKEGKIIIDLKECEDACLFVKDKARVKKAGKWGVIDKTGAMVIPFEYDNIGDFINITKGVWLAIVSKKGKWGAIDENGQEIVEVKYGFVSNFSEQRACVLTENLEKCGYVNEKGDEIIPLIYDYRFPDSKFENGLVNVSLDGKLFWIDKNGNRRVPLSSQGL